VYLYPEHVDCSSADLAQLQEFMVFEEEEEEQIVPGSSSSVLDLNVFIYDNKTLLQMLPDNDELRCCVEAKVPHRKADVYGDGLHFMDGVGARSIWNSRLLVCLTPAYGQVQIVNWKLQNFRERLLSIFPNLKECDLRCTPFMVYTDILLVGAGGVSTVMQVMEEATVEGTAEMTLETSVVCIVGIQTPPTE